MQEVILMELFELMKQRHSVRRYIDKPVEREKRIILNELTAQINSKSGLNIQIIYDEPKCFDSFMAHYGKFSGVSNYIAVVGKKGEDVKLGYYAEMLVLKAQELGLNTCWVALTHGKSKATVRKGEKSICLISLGYGVDAGVPHKSKPLSEVSNYTAESPEWFKDGLEAALLAPTAMNQQKFRFELLPNGTVKAKCSSGFYTKLDLGIVQYHFETVTGKKVTV